MTGEITSTHRFDGLSVRKRIKCEDLQMLFHSQEIQNLRPLSLLWHLDINGDRMTDRSKEVRSESSAYKKDTSTPTSLTQLCKQLEGRITQKSQHYSICHEDRQSLTAVLTSELGLIWQNLKTPCVDTTLTQEEKVQLHCQTFSEVLHICEQLFLHYLQLTKTLQRRGVFSDCANRSRVAAQLAMDCTRLLNVRSIRCRIVTGIKSARKARTNAVTEQKARSTERSMTGTPWEKAVEDDLKEIQEKIGELDLQNVYDLLPCHMEPICYKRDTQCSTASMASIPTQDQHQSPSPNRLFRMKGCHSMPDLQRETLLEELEITLPDRPPSPSVLLSTDPPSSLETHISPGEDLRRLLQESDYKDDNNCETDLCPLIEAMICYNSSRLQRLKQRLQKLMEEEEETKKHKILAEKPSDTQGDVVIMTVSPQTIVRTTAARVSDRVLPETIKMYPPVYNDLNKEIDSASVIQMDRNLVGENMEISKVYEELSKSISTKYFNFDEDPRIEPALKNSTCCSKRLIDDKLINPSLRKPNPYSISHRERTERAANRKRPVDATTRVYRAWFQWWRCQLSVDDYLNYISNQDSDYLSVLFHLYDSDDEEAERHKLTQLQRDERKRRQQERISSLRRQKQEFVPGFWNINTIKMGGLGREPEPDERNPEEEIQDASGGQAACPGEEDEGPAVGLLDGEQMQVRLERVWNALHLPEGQRLDMAIKYSSHEYRDHLQEAIVAWEQAARLIQKRELLLSRLEDFEREASDPNRFFLQGYHGSSIARMEEASQREKLNFQIAVVDQELSRTMGHITTRFNDNISYKGRLYREKMRWDRTEMLYWLQQERRVQSLEMFVEGRTALPVRLPPLSQSQENHQTLHKQPLSDCERNGRLLQHCEL
ncbi:coiled-coil domain-containing protein 87 isoform X2 [Megalobrama amblycephala]|uniref:coiled-coil domain-containing protein 87 isoform X2 n=1 Tax=Megalobrama amblycephala TaxID=75352 RepID=UPI0020147D7A|nr:coiled-coil domain-containing protein 87 isoform X2 [Megalobrama amblycephala]